MCEKDVELSFLCSNCHDQVIASLRCFGSKSVLKPHAVSRVVLSCPHCASPMKVTFDLSGLVMDVDWVVYRFPMASSTN